MAKEQELQNEGTVEQENLNTEHEESNETEKAFVEIDGEKIPKKIWDKIQKEKQSEIDRTVTKATQTAREKERKQLEEEMKKKQLEAEGKWKELLEYEKQRNQELQNQMKQKELQLLKRQKLMEKNLDPDTWGELITGDSEAEILKSIETVVSNIENIKTQHLEELKKKGPAGVKQPAPKDENKSESLGERLAKEAKETEDVTKHQEKYFGK
jgi:hypothetical protein